MKNNKNDDVFLARWLNQELTEEELAGFKESSDYSLYDKIAKVSAEFEAPEFEKEKVLGGIKAKLATANIKEKKSKVIKMNWVYGAAASVLLLFSLFYYVNQPVCYKTGYGEQMAVTLPDGSEVILNSKSSIEYDENKWDAQRKINLSGEAFFKVEKGQKFSVLTEYGEVNVLGTQFNVNASNKFIEVHCFEGKVKVVSEEVESILTKGRAFRNMDKPEEWEILQSEPSWKNGETSFKSIPLKYVIRSIENQYGIEIKSTNLDLKQKFTGSFTHANLEVALKTVFEPMKIGVIFTDSKTVRLVKQ
ncbi:FecR family protein [Tenacibaculum sp. 190524A02b]|uniref:Transmembrane sensor n=1 Tax=Tenacibaculum vairaonense TaxID=3137860 RepID=A0ABM9PGP9_9FLAO